MGKGGFVLFCWIVMEELAVERERAEKGHLSRLVKTHDAAEIL